MFKRTGSGALRIVGIFSVLMLILAASPAEAQLQNHRSFTLAERQLLLIERMTNSALLAAFGIDASPSLNAIHWTRDRFEKMQRDLREGNPYSGLVPTTRSDQLEKLATVDLEWRQYQSIFADIVKSRNASKEQIGALTKSHEATVVALGQMVEAYEYFAYGGRHHSILSATITGTGRLRANTQLVLRGLMTVAYHDYAPQERERLAKIVSDFDQRINGLIHGNPDLRLLPAATQEIRAELAKVDRMWKEIRPVLESTAAGSAVTKDHVVAVAKSANDMAVPLTMVLIMYLSI